MKAKLKRLWRMRRFLNPMWWGELDHARGMRKVRAIYRTLKAELPVWERCLARHKAEYDAKRDLLSFRELEWAENRLWDHKCSLGRYEKAVADNRTPPFWHL